VVFRNQLLEILKNMPEKDPGAYIAKLPEHFTPKEGWRLGVWPEPKSVYIDGTSVANVWENMGARDVYHRGTEIHRRPDKQPDKQIDVWTGRTGRAMIELRDLKFTPYLFPDKGNDQLEILKAEGKALRVRMGAHRGTEIPRYVGMLVDARTGFVYHWSSPRHANALHMEKFQYGATKYPGDIWIPKVTVEAVFNGDRLDRLFFHVIKQVSLNKEIDPKHFAVPVPAGATVVDYRKDPQKPTVFHPPKAVPDILKELPEVPKPVSEAPPRSLWPWYAGSVLALIGCVGIVIFYRTKWAH
jgi:hypothetical protein